MFVNRKLIAKLNHHTVKFSFSAAFRSVTGKLRMLVMIEIDRKIEMFIATSDINAFPFFRQLCLEQLQSLCLSLAP